MNFLQNFGRDYWSTGEPTRLTWINTPPDTSRKAQMLLNIFKNTDRNNKIM